MEVRAEFEGDPRRVADARRLTEGTLAAWGLADLGHTAALLVSELVTNAILHARSGVVIVLRHGSDEIRIEVLDTSPLPPRVRHFRADAGTGRGVRLLDTLARRWGVERESGGKTVWFTLSTSPQPAPAAWEFDLDSVEPL
ncbi:MAG: ATP-binding protein [Actinomycetota bacterium]|nr:ATP-binding protein [Actinomycetota bacterium]